MVLCKRSTTYIASFLYSIGFVKLFTVFLIHTQTVLSLILTYNFTHTLISMVCSGNSFVPKDTSECCKDWESTSSSPIEGRAAPATPSNFICQSKQFWNLTCRTQTISVQFLINHKRILFRKQICPQVSKVGTTEKTVKFQSKTVAHILLYNCTTKLHKLLAGKQLGFIQNTMTL